MQEGKTRSNIKPPPSPTCSRCATVTAQRDELARRVVVLEGMIDKARGTLTKSEGEIRETPVNLVALSCVKGGWDF